MKQGTILITGANGGLGSAMVSRIVSTELGADYFGLYTVRNTESAHAINTVLAKAPRHAFDVVAMDLSSLDSVRRAAASINQRIAEGSLPRIRALILNAAYQEHSQHAFSGDGFDMTFQVNFLAQFLFTLLLLRSLDNEKGRILILGSWSHDVEDPRNDMGFVKGLFRPPHTELFKTTEALAKGTQYNAENDPSVLAGMRRYGASKLCIVMFMHELQARLGKDPVLSKVSVIGLDPGAMASNLLRRATWLQRTVVTGAILRVAAALTTHLAPNGTMRTMSKSAADALRACFDTGTLGEHPRALYLNGTDQWETGKEARDQAKRAMLWRDSVAYVQLKEGDTALAAWQ